jgi:hypothetical protein
MMPEAILDEAAVRLGKFKSESDAETFTVQRNGLVVPCPKLAEPIHMIKMFQHHPAEVLNQFNLTELNSSPNGTDKPKDRAFIINLDALCQPR